MSDLVGLLQDEVDMLRERVRELEAALAPESVSVPLEWGLTSKEAAIYRALASRPQVTREGIMLALYSDRADAAPEIKIVDVFICNLRKKVLPFGVEIKTVWGAGYALQHQELALPVAVTK